MKILTSLKLKAEILFALHFAFLFGFCWEVGGAGVPLYLTISASKAPPYPVVPGCLRQ